MGPLLEHCSPSSVKNGELLIEVNHLEDVPILKSASEFLTKRYQELHKVKLKMDFNFSEENKNNDTQTAAGSSK